MIQGTQRSLNIELIQSPMVKLTRGKQALQMQPLTFNWEWVGVKIIKPSYPTFLQWCSAGWQFLLYSNKWKFCFGVQESRVLSLSQFHSYSSLLLDHSFLGDIDVDGEQKIRPAFLTFPTVLPRIFVWDSFFQLNTYLLIAWSQLKFSLRLLMTSWTRPYSFERNNKEVICYCLPLGCFFNFSD